MSPKEIVNYQSGELANTGRDRSTGSPAMQKITKKEEEEAKHQKRGRQEKKEPIASLGRHFKQRMIFSNTSRHKLFTAYRNEDIIKHSASRFGWLRNGRRLLQ
eukprot:TRINITY_DN2422_c0_g1_i1.p1 TRINITY_DN2422_c0_g1~~TRINITY_DN2422_c0_g1_i1.p1  ORF type:complete len:103 (-),score=16.35 TRINITY_DN2422_c0_g1_i1:92-400(-)